MSTSRSGALDTPVEGLWSTPTARLPYQANVLLRSNVPAYVHQLDQDVKAGGNW